MGDTEEIHINKISDLMGPLLRHNGIEFKRNTPEMTHISSKDESNRGNYDLHYALHSNAYSGKETYSVVLYASEAGKRYAEIIAKHYRKIYPWEVKVQKPDKKLTELYETKAVALIDEITFHDNPETARWLHNNFESIAKNKVQALCECFGIQFKEPAQQIDVREFQRITGLVVDGVIGSKTKAMAEKLLPMCECILGYEIPVKSEYKAEYERQGTTHIMWVNPMAVRFAKVNSSGDKLLKNYGSFVNAMFFGEKEGKVLTVGTGYSEGEKITRRLEWDNIARGTFIIHKNGSITITRYIDPEKYHDDIWFCVQGVGLNPIDLPAEWQPLAIGRITNRIMLGYNPQKQKVVITYRPDTDIQRGRLTLINLGCVDDKGNVLGIGLDSGTPATFVKNGEAVRLANYLDNIIYW